MNKMSYKKLKVLLIEKDIRWSDLPKISGIATNTLAKLGKNEDVSTATLRKIASALDCNIGEMCEILKG